MFWHNSASKSFARDRVSVRRLVGFEPTWNSNFFSWDFYSNLVGLKLVQKQHKLVKNTSIKGHFTCIPGFYHKNKSILGLKTEIFIWNWIFNLNFRILKNNLQFLANFTHKCRKRLSPQKIKQLSRLPQQILESFPYFAKTYPGGQKRICEETSTWKNFAHLVT